jgi:hypothetical protein
VTLFRPFFSIIIFKMRYSFISAAILAFTSSVFAQTANFDPISVPTQDQQVAAGSSLDITWEPSTVHTGPITIQLLQGATPSTLEIGETIKAAVDQTLGKYTWDVPADLKSFATYGFKITLDSTATDPNPIFQFSFPFHITGLSGTSTSSGYSASATGGTTTVHLSTGTGYTAKPTTSSSVNSTSTYEPSTTSSVVKPTSYSASATTSVYGTGNVTIATTLKPTASSTASSTSSGSNTTSSTPAQATTNSAVNNMARGGFAVLGGLVLAFAL